MDWAGGWVLSSPWDTLSHLTVVQYLIMYLLQRQGVFVMGYCDFLEHFGLACGLGLWVLHGSSATSPVSFPSPHLINFNDLTSGTVTFNIPEQSESILVLSQPDDQFFRSVAGAAQWSFDFMLFKVRSKQVIGNSAHTAPMSRSVMLRIELPPGDYAVQLRNDKTFARDDSR